MKTIRFFKTEFDKITNSDYRDFVKWYLDNKVPDYFWEVGASSTGRYHPKFSQKVGGLVRHSKAVCLFAEELLKISPYADFTESQKDYVRIACLLHDTMKYGVEDYDKNQYKNHETSGAIELEKGWREYFKNRCPMEITDAIYMHMGKWSVNKITEIVYKDIAQCVHLADYIASRNFIDIEEITKDYEFVESTEIEDVYFYEGSKEGG